ncbi:hypothetical protein GWK47_030186 [Chionoecetes opilio]|uniref:RanBP2-type domain-containing protein n=1 Tax=Chionoecetes opilio TaxID=41210 RepID=A0A8J4YRX5_CHIOP|nr:hypothetical protein GWK47_030186 [Chionoecetes opilio]
MAREGSVPSQEHTPHASPTTTATATETTEHPTTRPTDNATATTPSRRPFRHSASCESTTQSDGAHRRQGIRKSDSLGVGVGKWSCRACRFLNLASTDQCVICARWRTGQPLQFSKMVSDVDLPPAVIPPRVKGSSVVPGGLCGHSSPCQGRL